MGKGKERRMSVQTPLPQIKDKTKIKKKIIKYIIYI